MTKQETESARDQLRELLPPGSKVSTILRHASSSGMTRAISPIVCTDGTPDDISRLVARAVPGLRLNNKWGGITMSGCGMDMGFELVYVMSRTLYPGGWLCVGDRCPSNDHSNGDRNYSPHTHRDGGYAIRQEWL